MGSSTPEMFGRKMGRVAGAFRAANGDPATLRKMGYAMADELSDAARAAGATSFAGKPLKGWRTYVRGDTAYVRPSNPGAMVAHNSGTVAHMIGNRRTRRGAGKRALAGPGFGPVRGPVLHPGTRGRRFVAPAALRGEKEAAEALQREVHRKVRGILA